MWGTRISYTTLWCHVEGEEEMWGIPYMTLWCCVKGVRRDTLEVLADFCTQSKHETYAVVYPALQSKVVGVVDVIINHE